MRKTMVAAAVLGAMMVVAHATAAPDADRRAQDTVARMTQAEKLSLVFGYFGAEFAGVKPPKDAIPYTAGYIPGVPRLNVPPQWQTDAGLGVATQPSPQPRERTALPSGLATASSWNTQLAFDAGAMIGREARLSGHNVILGGAVNLMREPRNGRNFEYAGEDPLLAGVITGEQIRGNQSNHIVATVKHFAFNDQETNRNTIDVKIDEAAGRMSDLLALQIAIERGDPGSVMCSYNLVNGVYACESDWLLNQVLKKDWGYKGFVMSDWGATHSTVAAANAGLDQQSGWPFDKSMYFGPALKEAVDNGHVPPARLDDMARRIVRAMYAAGVMDAPPAKVEPDKIDFAAHAKVTQRAAEEGMVLLKNDGVLPLALNGVKTIAVIGGHADKGVISGGGAAQVHPVGGSPVKGEGPKHFPGPIIYLPSSPLKSLAARTQARVTYHDGKDPAAAAKAAAAADVAIVFATQWMAESLDAPSLSLPDNQDALIAAVAGANKRTVVVLETGGPVTMPWLGNVNAVLAAWFPGSAGGEAIARVLAGEVNPSGRLAATFPASEAQLPRPKIDGDPTSRDGRFTTDYNIEGAAVGYKWFDKRGIKPLFAFGHGLSYTTYEYRDLKARHEGGKVTVSFTVANTGKRPGQAVSQVYVSPKAGGWEAPRRLAGWDKVALQPGERKTVSVTVDPRVLSIWDPQTRGWRRTAGDYEFTLGGASDAITARTTLALPN
ncbi:beta-glucosidase [Pseudoduganella flava]|uniref:Beta-glucosidase n=1 Tax=Pseudoduganella flava TaxID=871742 RepID=A0A562PZJ5_9BURK|nr:glycoside hydrolase family 3 C-terminal domain-containing protein [Pseudoduganella flava]QGZ38606.1 glycosyl hydrolase [Pseudoduganella flava]TWI49824.1 beta-glucosidase [Pseudoduganella flava]